MNVYDEVGNCDHQTAEVNHGLASRGQNKLDIQIYMSIYGHAFCSSTDWPRNRSFSKANASIDSKQDILVFVIYIYPTFLVFMDRREERYTKVGGHDTAQACGG